jgi:hypothetical protein
MKCEICNKEMTPIKKLDSYELYKCKSCGFMNLDYGFAEQFIKGNDRLKTWTKPSKANISRAIQFEQYFTDKNILDLGSGGARYQQGMERANVIFASYTNVDTEKVSNITKLAGYDVIVADTSSSELIDNLPKIEYNTIICSHVLEHLPYPSKVLDIWKNIVKKDVYIYIEVPTYDNINMEENDWLVYEHMSYFTQSSFLKLMNKKFKKVESGMHNNNNIYYIGTTKAKR